MPVANGCILQTTSTMSMYAYCTRVSPIGRLSTKSAMSKSTQEGHPILPQETDHEFISSHLAPGGYLEHAEISPVLKSDDGSIDMDEAYHHQGRLAIESTEKFGKQINIQPHLKDMIIQAGFEDVKEFTYKWPIGEWPQDPRLKDIGGWNARHWMEGLETWTLRLLTQYMGVSQVHEILTPMT